MNILFLTIAFPEKIEDRNLYTDLMNEFKKNGHSVYIVTSRERRYGKITELLKENNLNVLRVKTGNLQKVNFIEKGISTIFIEGQFIKAIKKYFYNITFDLVIYSTPPITFERVVKFIKHRDKAKSYLLLKDIFPQNAVDIEIIKKSSILYRYFRRKEVKLYKISDYIGCMSKANVDYVVYNNKYLNPKNVEVCPNSINPLSVINDKKIREELRKKYDIHENSIVVGYGGNLGKPQGIDFLIDILESNKYREDMSFLIIGSGTEYNKLQKYIVDSKLTNIRLYPYLPKSEYDEIIQVFDVGLIFLDNRFTIPNFPSRLLTYMEFYIPVIAATDVNTDIGTVITDGNFGFWCESGDIEAFNKNLAIICNNRALLNSMGYNSRKYLEDNYTVSKSYEIIMKHFK